MYISVLYSSLYFYYTTSPTLCTVPQPIQLTYYTTPSTLSLYYSSAYITDLLYHTTYSLYCTSAYLSDPAVQLALHAISSSEPPISWKPCSDPLFYNWSFMDVLGDTTTLFATLYRRVAMLPYQSAVVQRNGVLRRKENFKMLIYSGDSDGVCLVSCAVEACSYWIIVTILVHLY